MTGASILKNYFYRLYQTLLESHVKAKALKPTREEEDCVKAFCVLAHAAVEEYIELLCKDTLHKAYMKYKSKSIITRMPTNEADLARVNLGIVQLIETLLLASNYSIYASTKSEVFRDYKLKLEKVTEVYKSGGIPTANELAELTKKTDSYARGVLKETKAFFDTYIEQNHGASLKYLLKLLIPVGIDVPNSLELNSLQKLAEYRGNFAHGKGLTHILSASDLVNYAVDVVKLCFSIERSIDDFTLI